MESPSWVARRLTVKHQVLSQPETLNKRFSSSSSLFSVMKTKSRSFISAPTDRVRPKSHQSEEAKSVNTEPPRLIVEDVDSSLNMSQLNGYSRDSPVEPPRIASNRVVSPSFLKTATLSLAETSSTPTPEPAWSSAVGHASTGKSGRVIERLQGDIDRLHRDKQLLKVQFEEAEKANETLNTRNQYLQDRNSNYEHAHETNLRQLERKERQVQELRGELKKEQNKTAKAEERARVAMTNEETYKEQASEAEARAAQKETEYEAVVSCRNMDNDRHQGGIDKIKAHLDRLAKERQGDIEKQRKLEIIAEQQRQTIAQLEELTRKLTVNFKQYRTEIDAAIADLRQTTSGHDTAMEHKLQEMQLVTGQMRWVMNVEREVNHKKIPPMPQQQQQQQHDGQMLYTTKDIPSSSVGTGVPPTDGKGKHARKGSSRTAK